MKPHPRTIWFFVLFLAGLCLRAALVSQGPYHSDTLSYANSVKSTVEQKRLVGMHGHGYPLTALLGAVFYKWTAPWWGGDPVRAINVLNVIWSAAAFFPFYYLAVAFLSRPGAAVASLLFIVNPLLLSVSVYGNSHAPALLFSLLSLCFLIAHKKSGQFGPLFWSSLFFGLTGAARIQDAVVLIAPWAYCFFSSRMLTSSSQSPESSTRNAAGVFLAVAGFATGIVLLFYIILKSGRTASPFDARLLTFNLIEPYAEIVSLYHLRMSLGYLIDIFSVPGIVAAVLGAVVLLYSNRSLAVFLLLWFLVPFAFFGNHFMVTPRWLVPAVIPVLLAETAFFLRMFFSSSRPVRGAAVLIFCGLLTLSLTQIVPVLWFRHRQAITPEYARWIGTVTEPDAVIIVGDDGPFIGWYGDRRTIRQIVTDTTYFQKADTLRRELKEYKRKLNDYLNKGTPVYITEIGLKSNNQGVFYLFLTKYFRLKYVGEAAFEVWHRSCLHQQILKIKLYQIEKQDPSKEGATHEDSADSQP